MIFGLVPASTLAAVEQHLAEMQRINARLQVRFDELQAKYHDLVSRPTTAMPKREKDPVLEAIGTMAGNNGFLRKQLGQFAKEQRAQQIPTDDIVHDILNWRELGDEDAA